MQHYTDREIKWNRGPHRGTLLTQAIESLYKPVVAHRHTLNVSESIVEPSPFLRVELLGFVYVSASGKIVN